MKSPLSLRTTWWLMLCLCLSGCLIGSNTKTKITGKDVSDTWTHIRPGDSKDYVTALLGEPTDKTSVSDGREIWKWQYTEQKDTNGYIFFILGSHNSTQTQKTTTVEFKDGVVAGTWQEGGAATTSQKK